VGCGFLIELAGLGGRARLDGYDVHALLRYEDEPAEAAETPR